MRRTLTGLAKVKKNEEGYRKNWKGMRRRDWGVDWKPWMDALTPPQVPRHLASRDMVVRYARTKTDPRLLYYLGKHVPHAQKSLWSPDTPVQQDRHLFMLSTIDIDGFKYWFGMRRALVHRNIWPILAKASLLPPSFHEKDSLLMPRPIFSKDELYRYYLKNRKSIAEQEREDYLNYENSMVKTEEERQAQRPAAPWL